MTKKLNDIRFKKSFRVRSNQNDYTFKLKRRRCWWWLLLLLLPLLLLINCSHDVTVTVTTEDGKPVKGMKVDMSYTSHWLYNDDYSPAFFAKKKTNRNEVTDSNGKAVFKDVKTSVLGYIFYCMSTETFTVHGTNNATVEDSPMEKNLHFTRHVDVVAKKKPLELVFRTVNANDKSLIPNCKLTVTGSKSGQLKYVDNSDGTYTIKNVNMEEEISIVAEKPSFTTNNYTIKDKKVKQLYETTNDEDRDIPMIKPLDPCDPTQFDYNSYGEREQLRQYSTGSFSGVLRFAYDTYVVPDRIRIYNGTVADYKNNPNQKPIWETKGQAENQPWGFISTDEKVYDSCSFNSNNITVVIDSNEPGTCCDFKPECPQ